MVYLENVPVGGSFQNVKKLDKVEMLDTDKVFLIGGRAPLLYRKHRAVRLFIGATERAAI